MRLLGVQRIDQLSLQHVSWYILTIIFQLILIQVNTRLVDSQTFDSGSSMSNPESAEIAFPIRAKM